MPSFQPATIPYFILQFAICILPFCNLQFPLPISNSEVILMEEPAPLLSATNLYKTYRQNALKVRVLRGLNLDVYPGEFLSVVGVSRSGKSTLLHLLGTIDRLDEASMPVRAAKSFTCCVT